MALFLYAVVALGFAYLLLTGLSTPARPVVAGGLLLAALAGLLVLDCFERARHGEAPAPRAAQVLLGARLALIVVAVGADGFHLATGLFALVPLRAFAALSGTAAAGWTGAAYGCLFALLTLFKPGWSTSPTYVYTAALALLALGLAAYVALALREERGARRRAEALLEEVRAAHRALAASARQAAELAALQERTRLARDIHDSLGHHLTAMGIQLEKALVFAERRPAEALQATRDAKRLADEALDDVRRSVGVLRGAQGVFRLGPALERLAATVRDLGGLDVRLRVTGSEHGYRPQTLLALFRAAQEGLTNVQRHAGASRAHLHVDLGEVQASLCLEDDGRGLSARASRPSTYGLLGLRERLEPVGGHLRVQNREEGGTRLDVHVPREFGPAESP